jgi:hypothetical protein
MVNLITSFKIIIIFILILISSCLKVHAGNTEVLLREDFQSLENWDPLYFKKIKSHTTYKIYNDGDYRYLKAESDSSASGMVYINEFNIYDYPNIRWRWKVSNVYEKGDAATKEGDDYPMRIYVMFKYDPDKASFGMKFKYGLAKKMYGTYPPHSTLNYIWANREHEEHILTNRYAKEAKMIIVQSGAEHIGKWMEHEVNVLEDYRKAFGKDPPATASIAVMNDSDNTGESSVSFIDYIEVYK